ncbi:glycogen synthase GlgA [Gemmatimonadota bacterium]
MDRRNVSQGIRTRRVSRPTVVFVASEAVPFAKTGGLADVTGALVSEMADIGCKSILIIPKYQSIPESLIRPTDLSIEVPAGRRPVIARVWESRKNGNTSIYLLDIPAFFDRRSLYGEKGLDYPDNLARFAALNRGALELLKKLRIRPHIIHVHDWQTSLIPLYLKSLYRSDPFFERTRSVLTIHNLSYQGQFRTQDMRFTGLSKNYLSPRYLEYFGDIRLLKGGIVSADWITTVSPTYEEEIQNAEFGCGIDGVIRSRAGNMTGILNGIDMKEWDPSRDPLIASRFSVENLQGKTHCKRALLRTMGLPTDTRRPLICILSRLVEQKGIIQAIEAMPWLIEAGATWVVLGEGDPSYELEMAKLATAHPDRIAVRIGYDNAMAHQIIAGSDYLLMPSLFEPCGLSQIYAQRYGTIPVVRGVGGLVDTVSDFTRNPNRGTGFVFQSTTPQALMSAVHRAFSVYRQPKVWTGLRRWVMSQDFSWRRSALEYLEIYQNILAEPRSPIQRGPRA